GRAAELQPLVGDPDIPRDHLAAERAVHDVRLPPGDRPRHPRSHRAPPYRAPPSARPITSAPERWHVRTASGGTRVVDSSSSTIAGPARLASRPSCSRRKLGVDRQPRSRTKTG